MANLASTAVTVVESWTEGDTYGKRLNVFYVKVVLSAQGGGTNLIPASVIMPGFNTIVSGGTFVKSDNSDVQVSSPSYDRTNLLLGLTPADVTGTYQGIVKGY